MKRLTLAAFQAKNITAKQHQQVDQLLGQILGDCHDENSSGSTRGGGNYSVTAGGEQEELQN